MSWPNLLPQKALDGRAGKLRGVTFGVQAVQDPLIHLVRPLFLVRAPSCLHGGHIANADLPST